MTQGFNPGFDGALQQMRREMNEFAHGMRRAHASQQERMDKRLEELVTITKALKSTRSGSSGLGGFGDHVAGPASTMIALRDGSSVVRIEDIPGRRVPFDMLVDIPISNGSTSEREQSVTIPQEGPFIATARYATFQSTYQFQTTVSTTVATFNGRSYGRYRPIHSAWDLFDSNHNSAVNTPNPLVATEYAALPGFPSAVSSFRTMEFDGRVTFLNEGSGYPRQKISVPTSLWTPQINAPFMLGALDFFERGEVLTFKVQPNHVSNPPAGNVEGGLIFGSTAKWPFLAGQYDVHEGIATSVPYTAGAFPVAGASSSAVIATDTVSRLPDGILTIGFHGYRILQVPGPVG